MTEDVFVLSRDTSHLIDLDKDAWLIKFEGSENIHFALLREYELPNMIFFDAVFETLNQTDYPISDVVWPIMSKKMLKTLLSAGDFPHRAIPVVMENCRVVSYDSSNKPVTSGEKNNDFVIVQLLEHLDIFNWDKSIYKAHPRLKNRVKYIEKLVLNEPSNGFPPAFRLSARPTPLFISSRAYALLQEESIKGLHITNAKEFKGA